MKPRIEKLTEEEAEALAVECLEQLTEEAVYRVLSTLPRSVIEEAEAAGLGVKE